MFKSNVNDIDFYVGGLFENQIQGGVVGSTFACMIANQFKDLKTGDRFYYENAPNSNWPRTAFSAAQLAEIKKMTMSRLICNNYDVSTIQPWAFLLTSTRLHIV